MSNKSNKNRNQDSAMKARSADAEFMLLHKHGGEMRDRRMRREKERKNAWRRESWD